MRYRQCKDCKTEFTYLDEVLKTTLVNIAEPIMVEQVVTMMRLHLNKRGLCSLNKYLEIESSYFMVNCTCKQMFKLYFLTFNANY